MAATPKSTAERPARSHSASTRPLGGSVRVPGDKSISHRALMLSALAVGETRITGLLEGEDVLATAAALGAMGVDVKREGDTWRVCGVGLGGLCKPTSALDMGNAGTAARLLMGVVAGHPFGATFKGDASLSRRPMGRVTDPLQQMGAGVDAAEGGRLPLSITGLAEPLPIEYELPVPSAQVKSAVLLAGLSAPGETVVIETEPTRDHTENMLTHFGADVVLSETPDGGRRITLTGQPELVARDLVVPGDISSAAFPMVAALVVAGSDVTLEGVGVNPLRNGIVETLVEMGASIEMKNHRTEAGEAVADLHIRHIKASPLNAVTVPPGRAPAMIDEYPVLAVAAAMANGTTRMEGLGELRVKESDRLAAMVEGLAASGVAVQAGDDWLEVTGTGGQLVPGGATIATNLDHRIAMAFLVLGLVAAKPITVDDATPIETSFPGFGPLLAGLGAAIT